MTGLKLKKKGGVPTHIFDQGAGIFGTVITVILTKKQQFTMGFFGYLLNLDVRLYFWTVPNVPRPPGHIEPPETPKKIAQKVGLSPVKSFSPLYFTSHIS